MVRGKIHRTGWYRTKIGKIFFWINDGFKRGDKKT